LAAAARECPLVEKIVRIAASRVEEQKERDAARATALTT
jgi:hypothetical protein